MSPSNCGTSGVVFLAWDRWWRLENFSLVVQKFFPGLFKNGNGLNLKGKWAPVLLSTNSSARRLPSSFFLITPRGANSEARKGQFQFED
jgi:hypothetical protein